jgi:hypothetical protein
LTPPPADGRPFFGSGQSNDLWPVLPQLKQPLSKNYILLSSFYD